MGFGRTATVADGLLPLFGGPRLGGVSWRTNLADLFGGPRWRCRPWRPRLEPRRISDLRCDEHRVSDGVVWALAFGALRLALSDWRSHLAVSVGGVSWRCQLADHVGGVSCGGAASSRDPSTKFDAKIGRLPVAHCGHPQLALFGWRTLTGGAPWRCQLADLFGGPEWRSCMWRSGFQPRLISELRCEGRQVAGSPLWSPAVGALWLAEQIGGLVWRNSLAVSPLAERG